MRNVALSAENNVNIAHYSEVLQCEMTFSIYLPSNKEKKKIPLIWWLSGLTCTDDNFSQKSGFQRLAEKHQVAVMIPDTSPRGEHVPMMKDGILEKVQAFM